MRWTVSILIGLLLVSCSSEQAPDFPRDLSKVDYRVPASAEASTANQIRPSEQPTQLATVTARTITLPCRMWVTGNNIYMLDRPWIGSKRAEKPYRAGTILLAEKVAGEWFYVRDVLSTGWIHKDNLRPVVR